MRYRYHQLLASGKGPLVNQHVLDVLFFSLDTVLPTNPDHARESQHVGNKVRGSAWVALPLPALENDLPHARPDDQRCTLGSKTDARMTF
ncbi:hypothetical protein CIB48_g6416 [Xylaria polymorpha]|nr:hypothetical protein CIB48_g6416 [Xylaria polymorpha]